MAGLEDLIASVLGAETQNAIREENPYFNLESAPQGVDKYLLQLATPKMTTQGEVIAPAYSAGELLPYALGSGLVQGILEGLGQDYQNDLSQRYFDVVGDTIAGRPSSSDLPTGLFGAAQRQGGLFRAAQGLEDQQADKQANRTMKAETLRAMESAKSGMQANRIAEIGKSLGVLPDDYEVPRSQGMNAPIASEVDVNKGSLSPEEYQRLLEAYNGNETLVEKILGNRMKNEVLQRVAGDEKASEIVSRYATGTPIKPEEMDYVTTNFPGALGTNYGTIARGGAAAQAQYRQNFGDQKAIAGLGLDDPNRPLEVMAGSKVPYMNEKEMQSIRDLADSTQLGIQNLERLKAVYKKYGVGESIWDTSDENMGELGGAIQAAKDARDQTLALLQSSNPAWKGVLSEEKLKQIEGLLPPELMTEANASPSRLRQVLTNMNPDYLEKRVNELERELLHRSGTIMKNRGLQFKDSIAGVPIVAYPTEGLGQVPFGASPMEEAGGGTGTGSSETRTINGSQYIKVNGGWQRVR